MILEPAAGRFTGRHALQAVRLRTVLFCSPTRRSALSQSRCMNPRYISHVSVLTGALGGHENVFPRLLVVAGSFVIEAEIQIRIEHRLAGAGLGGRGLGRREDILWAG